MGADSDMGQMAAEQGCTRASLTPFLSSSSNAYLPLRGAALLFQHASARSPTFLGGNVRL
jgi:hypothetical protein